MAIVENIRSRISRRVLSIHVISHRDATLVDRRIFWQLSGIGNIVDYHPVENRRVFVARASPTAEADKIAPNHWTSTDLFFAAVYKRAYFYDGLLFSFAYPL